MSDNDRRSVLKRVSEQAICCTRTTTRGPIEQWDPNARIQQHNVLGHYLSVLERLQPALADAAAVVDGLGCWEIERTPTKVQFRTRAGTLCSIAVERVGHRVFTKTAFSCSAVYSDVVPLTALTPASRPLYDQASTGPAADPSVSEPPLVDADRGPEQEFDRHLRLFFLSLGTLLAKESAYGEAC